MRRGENMTKIKLNPNLTKDQAELVKSCGIKSGMTIYTSLKHVSKSGMTRAIGIHVVNKKTGDILQLNYLAVKLGVGNLNKKHGGITQTGCGMDMGFDLVYRLSRKIFGSSNSDGGYQLNHQWI
jgi:hypothetical protein